MKKVNFETSGPLGVLTRIRPSGGATIWIGNLSWRHSRNLTGSLPWTCPDSANSDKPSRAYSEKFPVDTLHRLLKPWNGCRRASWWCCRGCGHAPQLDCPKAFLAALEQFLGDRRL
jgi:pimeloyl-ACP methyl ester carboxylesterase